MHILVTKDKSPGFLHFGFIFREGAKLKDKKVRWFQLIDWAESDERV